MKHNTFEPCKDHENGHFNWCLLCEIENLRKINKNFEKEIRRLRIKTNDPTERIPTVQDIVNSWIKPPICFSDYDGLADHLKR